MPLRKDRVAVIGAGITGVTTAYKLAKSGLQVTLFDKHPYAAMETSFANGGQLSASNAEVWNSWTTILKGIKWMFTPGAPLLVNPKPSWHKLSWMAEFLTAIPKYSSNTEATARLAIEARRHLIQMAADEDIAYDCQTRGILHFYRSKKGFEHAAKVTQILDQAGLTRRAVTSDEIRSIEPTLQGNFYGGFYTESDFTGDIHKFTNGLASACRRLGVRQMFGCDVSDIDVLASEIRIGFGQFQAGQDRAESAVESFDKIVICGGVHSRRLAAQLGDRINVYPVKGYSITVNLTEQHDQAAAPWVSLLDDDAKIVTSRLGESRFRVAGTAEFNGAGRDIRDARIEPLVAWCRKHFPAMSTRQCVPWAGLRPMMPDMMPRVRAGRKPGVFYNTGHGHLGWTLSAVTAEMVTGLVLGSDQVA
ncbi:D-amino acid dehydrogenase small subunit (plasmid) [Neorhizobium galegae bv. officinalis bv. officinalis str. HAMBI 1141]|uniref:D-amino acid dehydrogenase small subunit n=1 Tax=Neorhizobium galegae bv. officinalis bv. officinalis str. HAMBI 1141 TaxID=1028801 RepID=A0A068THQ1_NEOGA|nr:D-amino acid dehydrogenase [Neorhizobium galegae]CDN57606.1 D-amino acid dehydrogenase small subunit [Neorhizobium galegae bv. officinalis bv. officinalis str. HAMBI 1141]